MEFKRKLAKRSKIRNLKLNKISSVKESKYYFWLFDLKNKKNDLCKNNMSQKMGYDNHEPLVFRAYYLFDPAAY
jgi:hypothetical protein